MGNKPKIGSKHTQKTQVRNWVYFWGCFEVCFWVCNKLRFCEMQHRYFGQNRELAELSNIISKEIGKSVPRNLSQICRELD